MASEAPEETLAFALSDGRVGVLSISGRKVSHPSPCTCKTITQCKKVSIWSIIMFDVLNILKDFTINVPLKQWCREVRIKD